MSATERVVYDRESAQEYERAAMIWLYLSYVGAVCFDDAVASEDRLNITVDGASTPFMIGYGSWDSPLVTATVLRIFLEEKLGYNAQASPYCGTSCLATEITAGRLHSGVELWRDYMSQEAFESLSAAGSVTPLAYTSVEG